MTQRRRYAKLSPRTNLVYDDIDLVLTDHWALVVRDRITHRILRVYSPGEARYHYPDEFPPKFFDLVETWREWWERESRRPWDKSHQ